MASYVAYEDNFLLFNDGIIFVMTSGKGAILKIFANENKSVAEKRKFIRAIIIHIIGVKYTKINRVNCK